MSKPSTADRSSNDQAFAPVSGFASDQLANDPPRWVVIVAALIVVAGVLAFPLYRDEHAPATPAAGGAR